MTLSVGHRDVSNNKGGTPAFQHKEAEEACPPFVRGFNYPKKLRLLGRAEFLALKNAEVKKISNPVFLVVYQKNGLAHNRLGLTCTKKIGKAVERNRFKRRVREFFRLQQDSWPQGMDFLFIAHKDFKNVSNSTLWDFLNRLGQRLSA